MLEEARAVAIYSRDGRADEDGSRGELIIALELRRHAKGNGNVGRASGSEEKSVAASGGLGAEEDRGRRRRWPRAEQCGAHRGAARHELEGRRCGRGVRGRCGDDGHAGTSHGRPEVTARSRPSSERRFWMLIAWLPWHSALCCYSGRHTLSNMWITDQIDGI